MKTNNLCHIQKACMICSKYSFIIGSLILLVFCFTKATAVQITGMIYLITAVGINLLLLFILSINLLLYPKQYLEILKTAAVMLLNIPVAVFYIWLSQTLQSLSF